MKFFVFVFAIVISSNAHFPLFGNERFPSGGFSRYTNQNRKSFGQPPIQLRSVNPVANFTMNNLRSKSNFSNLTNLLLKNVSSDAVWNSYKVYLF
jgi:hypothetical protein